MVGSRSRDKWGKDLQKLLLESTNNELLVALRRHGDSEVYK